MVRIIQSEEPAKHSTKISSLGDNQTVVCEQRNTDAKRFHQLFRGDLDWIVMKALEKHRDRRYETASEFARDIARHLSDEPVLAGPPSATYLLSKIVRRNKVAVLATSAIVAALIIGLVAALWGFANARHHRVIAETRLDRAEVAEHEAIKQRDIAREARTAAEAAVLEKAAYADSLERCRYNVHLPEADEALRRRNYRTCREKLESCPPKLRGWEWSFLKKRLDAAPVSFYGTGKPIYTPDGGRLISIGVQGSVDEFNALIWDATTGSLNPKDLACARR